MLWILSLDFHLCLPKSYHYTVCKSMFDGQIKLEHKNKYTCKSI